MKSLAHSRWECKSQVVFIPKDRRKTFDGELRQIRGDGFHELARQKEGSDCGGALAADPVHMGLEIPPKHAVASVIGFLKGKSALAIARRVQEKDRNFVGEHIWARGYAVSTVGFELESVKEYSREQETADKEGRF
jgi:putative transposase